MTRRITIDLPDGYSLSTSLYPYTEPVEASVGTTQPPCEWHCPPSCGAPEEVLLEPRERCPVADCLQTARMTLGPKWQGKVVPIVGCGNPWHYIWDLPDGDRER